MGISVGDLLSMDFFKDFHVIAGHKGLNREIQGVSFLEVPEGHRWSIGKELIFTSGYIFAEFEGYLDKFCENFIPSHAALVIKRGSYLDKIPEKLIEIYDRNSIPLITMPYSPSWMTVVNQVNVGVLNHAIQSLRIDISQGPGCYNQNYKEQAIQKILKTLETEMEFPAFLKMIFHGGILKKRGFLWKSLVKGISPILSMSTPLLMDTSACLQLMGSQGSNSNWGFRCFYWLRIPRCMFMGI